MDERVRQAIRLIQADQREAGKELLKEALRANPYDEKAWLWLVEALDTPKARQRALEACLRYLPNCEAAQQGLMLLRQAAFSPPAHPVQPEYAPLQKDGLSGQAYLPSLTVAPTPTSTYRFPLAAVIIILVTFCMAGLTAGVYFLYPRNPVGSGSSQALDPSGEPVQYLLSNARAFTIADNDYAWTVTPKATYQVTARVLGKRNYAYDLLDMRANVSPYDLALGWGVMSDPSVDQWITWSQHGRWYFYEWVSSTPYTERDIGLHSANTHIIPANANITKVLDSVQINDVIFLSGYLVNIITEINGTKWYVDTSLTRADTGDGGCEQLYVERIIWDGKEYR